MRQERNNRWRHTLAMPPIVRVLGTTGNITLAPNEPVTFPAGPLLISMSGVDPRRVRLDGNAAAPRVVGGQAIVAADFTNRTGFHHLDVGNDGHYWIGSEDAKLHLEGLQAMLTYLRSEALWWTGQLSFSDGSNYRDPHVVYSWLDRHADSALSAAEDIAGRPWWGKRQVVRRSRRGGGRILVRASVKMLRKRPSEMLEDVRPPSGLPMAGRRVVPLAVMRADRNRSLDTPANRRAAWLITTVRGLARDVLVGQLPDPTVNRCGEWLERCRRLLAQSWFAGLPPDIGGASAPTMEEQVDVRYAATLHLIKELTETLGWSPGASIRPLHAYVHAIDEVYQAFVAHVVADAIGAHPTSHAAGKGLPQFESDRWRLFLNVVPPPTVLRSWRSYTTSPDRYRPDILLVDKVTGATVIGDAKYRQDGLRASESSRRDVTAYLGTYGLRHAVIFYPPASGALVMGRVAAKAYGLTEVGLTPRNDLSTFAAGAIESLLSEIAEIPRWSD